MFIVQQRCSGPWRANQDLGKKLAEQGYGVGRGQWEPGAVGESSPRPPVWDDVCMTTSCWLHCYFSQHHGLLGTLTIRVASHKTKKTKTLDLHSSFRNAPDLSTLCYCVFLAYPDLPLSFTWPFHWSLVSKVYALRGRWGWKVSPSLNSFSQNLCLKPAPWFEVIFICINRGKGGYFPKKRSLGGWGWDCVFFSHLTDNMTSTIKPL